jgi:transposase
MNVRAELKQSALLCRQAAAVRDRAIRSAARAGMSRRAIARIVGVSVQRVHQAIKADPERRTHQKDAWGSGLEPGRF